MAIDFEALDKQINMDQLKKDITEAQENGIQYEDVPAGAYLCNLENLEIGETKDHRPMLKAMFRIKGDEDGTKIKYTKSCLFMNRVLYGTKNDGNMIASAVGWLKTLEPSDEVGDIVFNGYAQFADLVMDIAEDVCNDLEYTVSYDPDKFNSISIDAVTEV